MNAQEAQAYSDRIPALQVTVSRRKFSVERPLWELADHANSLIPYVQRDLITEADELYFANHIDQFASLVEALEEGIREFLPDFRWWRFHEFVKTEEQLVHLSKIYETMHDLGQTTVKDLKNFAQSWQSVLEGL